MLLALGEPQAGNPLRRNTGGPQTPDLAAAQAAAAAARASASAAALAQQTQGPLRRALDSIKAYQAAQSAARAAAQAAGSNVPNGLTSGGLEIDPGGTRTGAGVPSQSQQGDQTNVNIVQDAQRAILTWKTFNVGAQTHLNFDQSAGGDDAASWVALNRVNDPSAAPSKILGSITAQGQVYVINRNGVVFGGTAQVNTGSLVISGLDLAGPGINTLDDRNARFLTGSLYNLEFAGPAGQVTVDPGASLTATGGGRIVILGGRVVNGGTLQADDGQVFLAGGSTISLLAADQVNVRGLQPPTPTVGGTGSPGIPYTVGSADGLVENAGIVSAARGNITLVGGLTLQNGLLTSTTSGEANGSINLGADGFTTVLGPGSVTQVLPDLGGKKIVGTADFKSSRIDVLGDKITVLDSAVLYAPSGTISLSAEMTAQDPTAPNLDDTRVYIGSGARIDVSGLRDVEVAMEQNTIKAELRANELRDDPLLRNNPALRSRTVYFDARLGVNPGVADLSGYYDLIEHDVTELMTRGGTVRIEANEIVTRAGSTIDLSGGSLRYLDGYVRRSVLIDPSGRRTPIEAAVPGVPYVGIDGDYVLNHARWGVTETFSSPLGGVAPRFEKGYVQGASAGTLELSTRIPAWYTFNPDAPRPPQPSPTGAVRILDGDVAASTVVGPYQRQLPTGSTDPTQAWRQQPRGGTLNIANAGDVTIANVGSQLGSDFGPSSALDASRRYQNLLPARWFDGSTFQVVSIDSGFDPNKQDNNPQNTGQINRAPGGHLSIGEGIVVNLGDGGSFSFTGKGVELDGTLLAPGGTVSLQALQLEAPGSSAEGFSPLTIHLGATGSIDVAGRLTNDSLTGGSQPMRALDGGRVSLIAARLVLDQGSSIDVSGGARLDATGTKTTAGNGGSITLDVSKYPRPDNEDPTVPGYNQQPYRGSLDLGGTLSGYALGKGGSLTINTGYDVWIGDSLPEGKEGPGSRLFTPAFFQQGGFASYAISGSTLVVGSGTTLVPSAETLVLPLDVARIASDAPLDLFATRRQLPDGFRQPMTLSLSTPGMNGLEIQSGATIRMEPGSTVRLDSAHLLVAGTIEAPGGTISLTGHGFVPDPGNPVGAPTVELTSEARLLATGYVAESLTTGNTPHRTVQSGGSITITSADTVLVDRGSVLDVSGIAATGDFVDGRTSSGTRYEPRLVDGNAGSVSIAGVSGLVAGILRLGAGGETGLGGSLVVANIAGGGEIVVSQSPQSVPAASGLVLSADRVNASGVLDVTLQSANPILFDGDVSLRSDRSLSLLTPGLARSGTSPSSVTLAASYVLLEGQQNRAGSVADPEPGGLLTVQADTIDVARAFTLGCITAGSGCGGFETARLIATGDIRLSDRAPGGTPLGDTPGLASGGALELDAAQVYVTARFQGGGTTLERPEGDPGFLLHSNRSITIHGNGNPAPVPLSFGERLTLEAPLIDQGGVLRAPQGQIFLTALGPNGSLILEPGSLTSTSLEGSTVPFGDVLTGGSFQGYGIAGEVPTKSINLGGANVAVKSGAVVDVSGGGDLLGYQFVPGNGGSRDLLSSSGGFAIVPSLGTSAAPIGSTASLRDSRLKVGDRVWLQGVPGLPDGYYTLLPAHYALLPGGFLIEPLGGSFASAQPTIVRPDGSMVASGFLAPGKQPGYGQFLVLPRDVFSKYSQIGTYSFNEFASGLGAAAGLVVRTPNDAGSVVFNASRSLLLQGTGRFGAGPDGLLGNLDISAAKIAVLGAGSSAPDSSYITLDPLALDAFGAGSILLGGTRSFSSGEQTSGTAVSVNAQDIYVANSETTAWTGPEIILAARNSVTVADGSVIRAQGPASVDPNPLVLDSPGGALLRLSTGNRVPLLRPDASARAPGALVIGAATLEASASLSLDGNQTIALAPGSSLSAGQVDLASVRVNLGDAPAGTPGVTLGSDKLAALVSGSVLDLLIRGYDSIDVYGPLDLGSRTGSGSSTLRSLTLDSGLIQGLGSGSSTITANDLTLRNSGDTAGAGSGGPGSLTLDVTALHLGPGQVHLAGYSSVQGQVGELRAQGTGGLDLDGDVQLAVGRLTAESGASYALSAVGEVVLSSGTLPSSASEPDGIGAHLSLSGSSLSLDAPVVLTGGSFEASATAGTLRLGPSAQVDLRGTAVEFPDGPRFAPGGTIRLASSGDLELASGARLDVSGAPSGGAAGRIELAAGGRTDLQGTLLGEGGAGAPGGSFSLDTSTLGSGLSALVAMVGTNGFDAEVDLRLRQQDLTLGAGERIAAHRVVLRSDTGRVTVAGEIDAGGTAAAPRGGFIQLVGGDGLSLTDSARLDAHAAQPPPDGFAPSSGTVELVATAGRIDVAPGARVDLSGGRSGGGLLTVRALRDGNDVAIDRLGADVVGARQIVVQGVQDYSASVVQSGLVGTMLSDASTWLQASGSSIAARLLSANPDLQNLQVAPGMRVLSSGDLTVQSDVDLSSLAGGTGAAGYLGLIAAGNLDVAARLSDGFAGTAAGATLLGGESFGYGLEAGGDVILEGGSLVRTGTGSISVVAGRDLVLRGATTPGGTPAVLYTAGRQTPTPSDFLGAPSGMPLGAFPTEGGDIDLRAGRDILAPFPAQSTSAWLFRYGASGQTSWSVVYANFEQGVGALGGGDVRVHAGRDIRQLSVSIPTTGWISSSPGVRGGGDLSVWAGGDIHGGLYLLGRGAGDIQAGGAVLASDTQVSLRTSPNSAENRGQPRGVGLLVGLMDATLDVTAGSSAYIEGAFDPTLQGQISQNLVGGTGGTAFRGLSERAGLSVTSLSGDVRYENDPYASVDLTLGATAGGRYEVRMTSAPSNSLTTAFAAAPPTLRLTSLDSSVFVEDQVGGLSSLTLSSSPRGNLELLARQDVHLALVVLSMDDRAPAFVRDALAPYATTGDQITNPDVPTDANNFLRGATPLHADDPDPARIYALEGSVCGQHLGDCSTVTDLLNRSGPSRVIVPKSLEVIAGKDIASGSYRMVGLGPNALSFFKAGRNVFDPIVSAEGRGSVLIEAGKDIVLDQTGSSTPDLGGVIVGQGNATDSSRTQVDSALPANRGVDFYLLAGTANGVNWDGFAGAYLDPANGQNVVRTYLPELADYMKGLGITGLSGKELVNAFQALPLVRREIFLDKVYLTELQQTGVDYNDASSVRYQSYSRGYRAISLLFPRDPGTLSASQRGSVILNAKPLETQAQGDINILAPYGSIEVGADIVPAGVDPATGGIATRRGGNIRMMSDLNIDLFTSRVFTLQGGDVLMWTSNGSITAGFGSKTSVFQKPLAYVIDAAGRVSVDSFGLQTGAGIGVLDALQNSGSRPRSRLDLVAPRGEVNAGDAGIRVVGDINIAAAVVVGVENISFSGKASGVPKVEVPNVGALTSASQLSQAASQQGVGPEARPRTTLADLPSIITVEVVGYETPASPDATGKKRKPTQK